MDDDLTEQINALNEVECIIVEGKKDKLRLEELGVKSRIYTLNKPLYALTEEVAALHKQVAVLTDLDKEGKRLYGKLKSGLSRFGVRIDNRFRNYLWKTEVRQVEGMKYGNPEIG